MKINHLIKLNLIQSVVLMSLLISNISLSEEIKNINDIFKDSTGNMPRTNTVLRDFYQKDITEKNNLTIDCIRSEEHTSELQSRQYLVCRLLLEKKKNIITCNLFKRKYQKYH